MNEHASWSIAAALALALVLVHEGTLLRISDSFSEDARDLAGMAEIRGIIGDRWVETPRKGQLLEGSLEGMVGTLDTFSDFISEEEKQAFEESTTGKFGGLGIFIEVEEGLVKVIAPIEDTPAWQAGMLPGDLIYRVDGVACEFKTSDEAVRALKGEAGTVVVLDVLHEGAKRLVKIEIERAVIQIRSVKGTRLLDPVSKIGYLRITAFNSGTVREFIEAVEDLNAQGMRALILDLRGNPGGFLNAATSVADAFLDKGQIIVKTKGRDAESKETEATAAKLVDVPTALLIDSYSASASEILGGALSDHNKAILVGTRSYGKGSVQSIIPVLAGTAELKLTTQYYFTPKGRRIHRGTGPDRRPTPHEDKSWGLLPDIEVKLASKLRDKLFRAEGQAEMERLKARANKTELEVRERLHLDDPQARAAYRALLEKLGDPLPSGADEASGSDVAAIDSQGRAGTDESAAAPDDDAPKDE